MNEFESEARRATEETARLRETVRQLVQRLEAAERAIRDLSSEVATLSERLDGEGDESAAPRAAAPPPPRIPPAEAARPAAARRAEAAPPRARHPLADQDEPRGGFGGIGRIAAAVVVLLLIVGGAWWWFEGGAGPDGDAGTDTSPQAVIDTPPVPVEPPTDGPVIAPTPTDPPAAPAVGPTPAPADAALPGEATDGAPPDGDATAEVVVVPPPEAEPTGVQPPDAADPDGVEGVTPAPSVLPPAPALPENASQEVTRLATLAGQGDARAQHDLATAYALGQGVPRDYASAAYWYGRAADAGMLNAVFNLGVLTDNGWGVERDPEEAFSLYLTAADGGHADAQNAVGLAYAQGYGTEADPAMAASWFQAASTNGNPRGAFNLGQLFERGLDGEPDLAAAAGWYQIAAERGVAEAREALDRLTAAGGAVGTAAVPEGAPPPVAAEEGADAALADTTPLDPAGLRELQGLLTARGFDAGPADGVMGSRTRQAMDAFAASAGIVSPNPPTRGFLEAVRRAGE